MTAPKRSDDIPRCETCAHWHDTAVDIIGKEGRVLYVDTPPEPEMREEGTGHPFRTDEPVPGRWGWCKKVAEHGPRSGSDRFYVIDASEYHASLSTRSDFGCVEHAPKGSGEAPDQ